MVIPNFYFEKKIWKQNFHFIAGLDEAGRGALAGPVVCGCVVYSEKITSLLKTLIDNRIRIDDSKRLTPKQREKAYFWIKENCLSWGVGKSSAIQINNCGIVEATTSAFRLAVTNANQRFSSRIDFLLIDAFYVPYIRGIRMPVKKLRIRHLTKSKNLLRQHKLKLDKIAGNQLAVVHGDQKSFSVASASIIAKVTRDNLMQRLGKNRQYLKYFWDENKGYGTIDHQRAILKNGLTRQHRKKYLETFLKHHT